MADGNKSSGNQFEIHNNVHGGAQQINVGQTGGTAKMEVGHADVITVGQLMDTIAAAVRDEAAEFGGTAATEAVQEVVEPLRTMAARPDVPPEEVKTGVAKLAAYAAPVARSVATFSVAALKALATSNPVVAGVVAMVDEWRAANGGG